MLTDAYFTPTAFDFNFDNMRPVEGKGRQMLNKMGWSHGQGLGRNNEGMVEPIIPQQKRDRLGVDFHGSHRNSSPVSPPYSPISSAGESESEGEEVARDGIGKRKRRIERSPEMKRQKFDDTIDVDALRRKYVLGEDVVVEGESEVSVVRERNGDEIFYPLLAIVENAKREVQRKLLLRERRKEALRQPGSTFAPRGLSKREGEDRKIYEDLIAFKRDRLADATTSTTPQQREPAVLSVRELKELLGRYGVDHSHCVEKEELVQLVVDRGLMEQEREKEKEKEKEREKKEDKKTAEKKKRVRDMIGILLSAFEGERIEEMVEEIIEQEKEETTMKEGDKEVPIVIQDDEAEQEKTKEDSESKAPLEIIDLTTEGEKKENEENEQKKEQGVELISIVDGMEIDKNEDEEAKDKMEVEEQRNETKEEKEKELENKETEKKQIVITRMKARWRNKLALDGLLSVLGMLQVQYGEEYYEYQLHWVVLSFLFTRYKKVLKSRWAKWLDQSLGSILQDEENEDERKEDEEEEEEGKENEREREKEKERKERKRMRERKMVALVNKLKESLKPWAVLLHSAPHSYLHPTHINHKHNNHNRHNTRNTKSNTNMKRSQGLFRGKKRGGGWSVFAVDEDDDEDEQENKGGGFFFSFTEEGSAYYSFLHLFLLEQLSDIFQRHWRDTTKFDAVLLFLQELRPQQEKKAKKGQEREKNAKEEKEQEHEEGKDIDAEGMKGIRKNLIEGVCVQKLRLTISLWELSDREREEYMPHMWLHPWLPLFFESGVASIMEAIVQDLILRIQHFVNSAAFLDPAENAALRAVLVPWLAVLRMGDYSHFLDDLSANFLVPRLAKVLDDEMPSLATVTNHSKALLRLIFDWARDRILSVDAILLVLKKAFFPRWLLCIQDLLMPAKLHAPDNMGNQSSSPELNRMEKGVVWYNQWKECLSEISPLLVKRKEVKAELNKALLIMNSAAQYVLKEDSANPAFFQPM